MRRRLRRLWWRHFTRQGRNFWRDLYLETLGFYDAAAARCEEKSRIIRQLRGES
jgi:hypothetical protein